MDNQKEYLNEEKYQKNNKKIKIAGIIVLLIGLGLIGFGIYNLILANSIKVPSMDDPNWFDMEAEQDSQKFTGLSLCMFGVFVLIVGCIIRFVIPNRRGILAYQAQQIRPVAQEGIEKIAPSVGVAAKEITKGVKEGLKENEK
ncbi:hypothetical protein IKF28_02180 [Candidatus Saccharibacteria bacterium]|nr:hypothetical protein [Candidatus Saccharibacteria bacterium]MBR3122232.1 hypothetical protein [Candidatus Saccharibacteria bacterium]